MTKFNQETGELSLTISADATNFNDDLAKAIRSAASKLKPEAKKLGEQLGKDIGNNIKISNANIFDTAEIKRMYARKKSSGIGIRILAYLEERAKEFGYKKWYLRPEDVTQRRLIFI